METLREFSVEDVIDLFREAARRELALCVDVTTRVISLSFDSGTTSEARGLVTQDVFAKAVNQMSKGSHCFDLARDARAKANPDLDYDSWMPATLKSS
jgi:hypothetical protein